mmetsp:Transcript_45167/g.78892  ORF Transcript_45167/g.78892 Transcript_45167/m.78892 type:complete len:387 (-) Transcript_45167:575-1735(-)
MGSGASAAIEGVKKEWVDVFTSMQFSRSEIVQFYEIYNTIDTDKSGEIDVGELLKFLGIESSIFTERIFEAFDKDGTGKIDFFEFVVSLWKFCALGSESINVFAFDLYDTDADGALTEIEVKVLFHDLYWYGIEHKEDEKSRRTLRDLLKRGEGFITIEEFRPFCQDNQVLLQPVFDVQNKLREAAMGSEFWESMSTRKIELSRGYSVALADLMVKAQDREDFNHMLQGKNKRGGVVRQLLHRLMEFGHHTGEEDDEQGEEGETGESLAKLFNPFRKPPAQHHNHTAQASSYSVDDQDAASPGKNSSRSAHGRTNPASHSHSSDQNDPRVKNAISLSHSGEHQHDHGHTNNNNHRAGHKDSAKSVPTIVLGGTSEDYANESGTLGQ